jgi:hypothetical protein
MGLIYSFINAYFFIVIIFFKILSLFETLSLSYDYQTQTHNPNECDPVPNTGRK